MLSNVFLIHMAHFSLNVDLVENNRPNLTIERTILLSDPIVKHGKEE